jgi:polyferredoxin
LRNGAYGVVLMALLSVFVYLLTTRKQVETTLLRTPGMLFQKQADGHISNLYSIEFVNKTFDELPITLELVEPAGAIIKFVEADNVMVHKESVAKVSFFLLMKPEQIKKINTPVRILVKSNGKLIEEMKSKFNGPIYKKE